MLDDKCYYIALMCLEQVLLEKSRRMPAGPGNQSTKESGCMEMET